MKAYLAVDIGASSGRHILGWVAEGTLVLREVHRFSNRLHSREGHLCWDMEQLFAEIVQGLAQCKEEGIIPVSMGIDTWAVDFLLLDRQGKPLGNAVSYRDSRTQGMDRLVEARISPEELYARTGIQKQAFNTIYQLMAVKQQEPALLEQAQRLLLVPEYLTYRLTGRRESEYTNATTTGLVNAQTKTWDEEILDRLGYPRRLFGELRQPGFSVGGLSPQVQERVGFDCQVLLPATHDTASAFLAVPAKENGVYLSSGTWSLLGTELPAPVLTEESRRCNFTNEGGYQYRFRYLKNIMGLWMLQSTRREAGEGTSFAALEQAARDAGEFPSRIDVNHPSFLAPESMGEAVRSLCRETGQPVPATLGELAACVYHSLAQSYARSIQELSALTGKSYTAVNVVGGGSRDSYLNQLTAQATGLPVYAGPTEGTALGNLLVQMLAQGEFPDLAAARRAIRHSFPMKEVFPC
ncbi:MAG TPA: rhamnulokinase [Candidatus Acutalibacter pullicola]|uniref:Rhamnulokinase n=1 Tax=Candidatus Acutalibacter pullicola TaxID=2838417 RepID=A0A9D2SEZ4_9FIRM|nr:rhamnulokinase [Candidatus Acutalibacter pullicola]